MAEKRTSESGGGALIKRQRTEDNDEPKSTTAMILSGKSAAEASGALTKTVKRTSQLQAPIMLLTGHGVGTCREERTTIGGLNFGLLLGNRARCSRPSFRQTANILPREHLTIKYVSSFYASFWSDLRAKLGLFSPHWQVLWNTYGDCKNYMVLKGHKLPILELRWSRDGNSIYSCSADTSVAHFDATTGERVRKFRGHSGIVNSISTTRRGTELVCSGSDDRTIGIYDPRVGKFAVDTLECPYQVGIG